MSALHHKLRILSQIVQPKQTVLSYHSDILHLVKSLQISQFRVLSGGGGGPYALACLKVIPRSGCLGGQIVSSKYPPRFGLQGMKLLDRATIPLGAFTPSVVGTIVNWQLGTAARNPDPAIFKEKIGELFKSSPDQEQKLLDDERYRTGLEGGMKESLGTGITIIAVRSVRPSGRVSF